MIGEIYKESITVTTYLKQNQETGEAAKPQSDGFVHNKKRGRLLRASPSLRDY
jgi:hypothetical protein